jgi:hypothetical protein
LYRIKYTSGLLGFVGAGVGIWISGAGSGFFTSTYTKVLVSGAGGIGGMSGISGGGGVGALMKMIL